ncbi:hypothetical protein KSP40_PGU005953 [Platanthera guangdongensis]|uniref:Uncharacterized protein n=1 Tax=Platanthera guangdongensis TaxID=2320717 RepID=A0ABR2N0U3_9ASPA
MKLTRRLSKEDMRLNLKSQKQRNQPLGSGQEAIAHKYAAVREKLSKQSSLSGSSKEKTVPSTSVSLLNPNDDHNTRPDGKMSASRFLDVDEIRVSEF